MSRKLIKKSDDMISLYYSDEDKRKNHGMPSEIEIERGIKTFRFYRGTDQNHSFTSISHHPWNNYYSKIFFGEYKNNIKKNIVYKNE